MAGPGDGKELSQWPVAREAEKTALPAPPRSGHGAREAACPREDRARPGARGPSLIPAPSPGSPAAGPHEARVHAPLGRPGPGSQGTRREVPDGARPAPAAQRGKSRPGVPDVHPPGASNFSRLPTPSGPQDSPGKSAPGSTAALVPSPCACALGRACAVGRGRRRSECPPGRKMAAGVT